MTAAAITATTVLAAAGAALIALALVLLLRLHSLSRALARSEEESRRNRQLADLDALTGLHNRRYFHDMLAREVARAHRYDRRLALIIFDLDDFKAVNDRIGHLAGDTVLAETAGRMRAVLRSADIACRVGGDEFAVVLPESTTAEGDQLLLGAISSRPAGHAGQLTVSAGIAELLPADDPTTFFERADEALYRAKERGKSQIVAARRPGPDEDVNPRQGTAGNP
jgi:two-component system, cell cycle response regulator